MRYVAPHRGSVDPAVFGRMPLRAWRDHADLLESDGWPSVDALNARRGDSSLPHFVAQTPGLLADGLHYEQRIAERGQIATRERNWHDLFNALAWLRYPAIKYALNARQVAEVARMGPKIRSRAQYALTHFDEAGVLVALRDPALLALWDRHDWHSLFWRERAAWHDGRIRVALFGHALLEHALTPDKLLVGKALVFLHDDDDHALVAAAAGDIARGGLLCDPLALRPLPLSGLPGWHPDADNESFHGDNPSYQSRRADRIYPHPVHSQSTDTWRNQRNQVE
jgi:hypothetical protein